MTVSKSATPKPVSAPARRGKWTEATLKVWLDWAVPRAPQNPVWHESPEGQAALRRHLLSQMVLVADGPNLRDALSQAKKGGVDLNVIAEEALVLGKRDLFFTLARQLKVQWDQWPRAQLPERIAIRDMVGRTKPDFAASVDECFRLPTMLHLLLSTQPDWVDSVLHLGWNPALPFHIEGSTLHGDFAICRAWMENNMELVEKIWAQGSVRESRACKDTFLAFLAFQGETTRQSERQKWISLLLQSGTDPNLPDLLRPGMPPAGLALLHEMMKNPFAAHVFREEDLLTRLTPERWPATDFAAAMLPYLRRDLARNEESRSADLMDMALRVPTPGPHDTIHRVLMMMMDRQGGQVDEVLALESWAIGKGLSMPFGMLAEDMAKRWSAKSHLAISLSAPFARFHPGVSVNDVSWTLLGDLLGPEDESRWAALGERLRAIEPALATGVNKLSRAQTEVWHARVALTFTEALTVSPEGFAAGTSPRRL